MLHTETVADGTLALIKQSSSLDEPADFRLVGGTALSLQIGHRVSVDIDLFTDKSFSTTALAAQLQSEFGASSMVVRPHAIGCKIGTLKESKEKGHQKRR